MRKLLPLSAVFSIALAGCSQADEQNSAPEAVTAAAESSAAMDVAAPSIDQSPVATPLPAALPKLAYVYGLAFELPSADIGKLMRRHADLCEQQGTASCRIVGMDLSGDAEREDASGKLHLAVAAPHARALSALLEKEADGLGAEQTATTIGSEEVSKTIVDTEARIRAREDLRDRLVEVLRTSKGSVRDLVEAERQVAAVNEEIDQARSWLVETKSRVTFSRMDIDYRSHAGVGSGFLAPITAAFGSLGSVLGFVIAALLLLAAVLGPIAALVWAYRRFSRRYAARTAGT